MTREELITLQPSLQKLVQNEFPMDEALHIVQLVERINPVLCDENIKEIELNKIEVTLSHDVKMTPTDMKLLSDLINFKEELHEFNTCNIC